MRHLCALSLKAVSHAGTAQHLDISQGDHKSIVAVLGTGTRDHHSHCDCIHFAFVGEEKKKRGENFWGRRVTTWCRAYWEREEAGSLFPHLSILYTLWEATYNRITQAPQIPFQLMDLIDIIAVRGLGWICSNSSPIIVFAEHSAAPWMKTMLWIAFDSIGCVVLNLINLVLSMIMKFLSLSQVKISFPQASQKARFLSNLLYSWLAHLRQDLGFPGPLATFHWTLSYFLLLQLPSSL